MVKHFDIKAAWDSQAGVWWGLNDELPLTTEAPTLEDLLARILKIVPEIAVENRFAADGDEIFIHVIAERGQSVAVSVDA